MARKVLGLVVSPRQGGNGDMALKEVLKIGEDWAREIIYLSELDIQTCKACYRCLPRGQRCHLRDDFSFLLTKIAEADGIVISAPCYFLGPHSNLKRLMDRLISLGTEGETFYGKPCLTITTYGIPSWQGFAQEYTNLLARFLHLDLKDSLLIRASYPGEFTFDPSVLESLEKAGRNLFDPKYQKELDPLACSVCWNPYLRLEKEGGVWCPACDSKGELKHIAEGLIVEFSTKDNHRFTPTAFEHHFEEVLPATVEEFLSKRQEIKEVQKRYKEYNWKIAKPAQE